MKCIKECRQKCKACKVQECRMWIDYPADLNCTYETINKNNNLSLREVAKRLDISFVRVKQIRGQSAWQINESTQKGNLFE